MILGYLARKKINKQHQLVHVQRVHCFCDYRDIKSMLLLYTYDELPPLQPIIEELRADGITIHSYVLSLRKNDVIENLPLENITFITRNNLEMGKRIINAEVLDQLLKLRVDAVMDLSLGNVFPFLQFLSASTAPLKLGLHTKTFNPYDLMIQSNEPITPAQLAKKIIFYLRSIDIKDNNL